MRKRIPTEMQDDSVIFCYRKRKEGWTIGKIALFLDKHHATIIYKIKKYKDLKMFYPPFLETIENYNETEFLKKLREL